MHKTAATLSVLLVVIGLGAACGSERSSFEPGSSPLPGDPLARDGGLAGGSLGEGGPSVTDPKGACSGDLRSTIDAVGTLHECPADQGCAAGKCVPACEAAAASKASFGCDYVVATPSFFPGAASPCFAIFVANNWPRPVTIRVERDGQSHDVTKFGRIPVNGQDETAWPAVPSAGLPAGQVAVLFMSSDPRSKHPDSGAPLTCPVAPALPEATAVAGSGRGKAWHLTTSAPVTAYDILPYGGAKSFLPSAELLFPTTAWGTNYVAVLPPRGSSRPQWGQVVATQADTEITLLPTLPLPAGAGGSPPAFPAGVASKLMLGAGEYVQWQESGEMSGTILQASKPFAFTGGQGYQCYRSRTSIGGGCDSSHQMIPPVQALGTTYAIAPYATRRSTGQDESIPYRFVGLVDGTTLVYSPPVPGAPTTLEAGQIADFEATGAFTVSAQDEAHPLSVGQLMSGCHVDPMPTDPLEAQLQCLGDEDYVTVLPPAQFLSRYVFFTDPSYRTTSLTFVRRKTKAGFQDVSLECMGKITGWKPLGTAGDFEFAHVDIKRNGVQSGACDNGGQRAESEGPFGVTVWGLDRAASYGYPAGGNLAPINRVVVVPSSPR